MQIGLDSPITHAYTDIIPGHALEVLLVHLLEGRAGGGGGAAAARRQVGGAGVAAAVLAALLLHDGVSILLARRRGGRAGVAATRGRAKSVTDFCIKNRDGLASSNGAAGG